MRLKCTECLLKVSHFTSRSADTTLLPVRSTQQHTRSIGWHKGFEIDESRFHFPRWQLFIQNLFRHFPKMFTLASLALLSWNFQFVTSYRMHGELKNYSEHKKFKCKFNVTVKICRAGYRLMLNHVSSQIRTINFCAVCLTSVSPQKDIYM